MAREKLSYYSLLMGVLRERFPRWGEDERKVLAKEITTKLRPPAPKGKNRKKALFVTVQSGLVYGPYAKLEFKDGIVRASGGLNGTYLCEAEQIVAIYTKFVKGGGKGTTE